MVPNNSSIQFPTFWLQPFFLCFWYPPPNDFDMLVIFLCHFATKLCQGHTHAALAKAESTGKRMGEGIVRGRCITCVCHTCGFDPNLQFCLNLTSHNNNSELKKCYKSFLSQTNPNQLMVFWSPHRAHVGELLEAMHAMQAAHARATDATEGQPGVALVHHGVAHHHRPRRGGRHDVVHHGGRGEDVKGQRFP